MIRERQSNKSYVREVRKTAREALHKHSASCVRRAPDEAAPPAHLLV
jgi:hypothetical protein